MTTERISEDQKTELNHIFTRLISREDCALSSEIASSVERALWGILTLSKRDNILFLSKTDGEKTVRVRVRGVLFNEKAMPQWITDNGVCNCEKDDMLLSYKFEEQL